LTPRKPDALAPPASPAPASPRTPPTNGPTIFFRRSRERGRQFLEHLVKAIAMEPPLRTVIWFLVFLLPVPVRWKAQWGAAQMAQYLVGVLAAADHARRQGIDAISVIEFGVATGVGLRLLERHAAAVERATGVKIAVYGFDTGSGLPTLIGDYRDHPDTWEPGAYSMAGTGLAETLTSRTTLVLGDVAATVPRFVAEGGAPPIGFISFDLDLYSSTREALKILTLPGKRTLSRVFLYFDDICNTWSHSYAGERLAIREFNEASEPVKIDRWFDVDLWRPFADRQPRLRQMFIAHDLEAISRSRVQ
jgi:hypothetical protein